MAAAVARPQSAHPGAIAVDFTTFISDPDVPAVAQWAEIINSQAATAGDTAFPPCALGAVISRESRGENVLQAGKKPGPGCGVGLTQITSGVDWSDLSDPKYRTYRLLDTTSNILVAVRFFLIPALNRCLDLRNEYKAVMETISPQILYFVFAAYNAGFGTVRRSVMASEDPDRHTTHLYAANTLKRYQRCLAYTKERNS